METIELKTSSGFMVTLKSFLTYKQFTQIQEIAAQDAYLDTNSGVKDLPMRGIYAANAKAMEFMIVSVKLPDGTVASNPVEAVDNMPAKDGVEVLTKINELTEDDSLSKKKGI